MRRRLSIAPADGEWLPHQLPIQWPDHIQEGTWRGVGPLVKGEGKEGVGSIGRFFSGKGSSSRLGGGGSSRAAAAGAATSPTSAYTTGHESSASFGGAWGSASRSTP